jgi:hypothetical protein
MTQSSDTRIVVLGALRRALSWEAELTSVRNRGELAEGWYDPSTRQKAIQSSNEQGHGSKSEDHERQEAQPVDRRRDAHHDDESSDDDDVVGPTLPSHGPRRQGRQGTRAGPAIPNMQDLELQRGIIQSIAHLHHTRHFG